LESGANVSDTHENIILAAIQSDNLDIVKLCVECGADTTDERILSRVVCMNNIKMLEFFLNIGIQITPMTFINAIHSNFLSMTKLLIQYGADVNCYNSEPIMVAIHNRYVETVELLLENGAIINTEIPTSNSDNAKLCSILRNYNIDDAIIIKLLIADE
jgi:ankyrin repeat protein